MNREEKNQHTRRRIMDSALREFSAQGYGASSINAICGAEGISKGIVYHYFETKDDLYLACVAECFERLGAYLRERMPPQGDGLEAQMERYFSLRLAFFQENPMYQRIFCDAAVMPPQHLSAEIQARRAAFDALNVEILSRLLAPAALRPDVTRDEVIDTFRQYQDYVNARFQASGTGDVDIRAREASCRRALSILLYGVIERRD